MSRKRYSQPNESRDRSYFSSLSSVDAITLALESRDGGRDLGSVEGVGKTRLGKGVADDSSSWGSRSDGSGSGRFGGGRGRDW